MGRGERLDTILVTRGLAESRTKAQALILAGEVSVTGRNEVKAGMLVAVDSEITLVAPPPYVSRGGLKLEHALKSFHMDVHGLAVADIGASTGGFTDCLLKHGARHVYAVDVGYGQIDYRLRKDSQVTVIERTNARYPFELAEKVSLITMDVSFISVQKIIPAVKQAHLVTGGKLLLLFKPQFEVEKKEVGKGGVIKNSALHAASLGRFIAWAAAQGLGLGGLVASPILGATGNREFLILLV
ncbi:TlyA family RNA methyltransferase [Chloroflexota bacterium]